VILKVGLTGGIASGKSTVARLFAAFGCIVVDADAIVARLYRPGQAGHAAIVGKYGDSVLREDGEIDRPKLAAVALATDERAKELNALIHPLVVAEQLRMMREEEERDPERDAIFVVEATLLLESGGRARFDRIVVVDSPREIQLDRGVARGLPREEVARRIARQMDRAERLRHADYVIENGGDLRALELAAVKVHESLRADLAALGARPARG
jgi:dephospho-CoA kinase